MAADLNQEYPGMLTQVQPLHATTILNDRVASIGRLNGAIADWLMERRRLEEQYARGLRKLALKNLEGVDLGIFSVPWTTLTASVDNAAESHSLLASKIEVDVERPLREFANSNREMTAMSTVQGNLGSLARDVDQAQQKTDKLRGKGERADSSKFANATSELDTAQAQWDSVAPQVFGSLQALDETRLNNLRDALTIYQTHEMDQLERSRVSGEQCLNVLLNVETADEIKTFALKAVQSRPSLTRAQRSSVSYGTPSRATTTPAAGTLNTNSPSVSRSEENVTRETTPVVEDKQKGRVKGLRRLGTVLGRKKDSKLPASADSPDSRSRASPLSGSRFGKSRENVPTLETMRETSPQQRPSLPTQVGSEVFDIPSEVRADPSTPPMSSREFGSLPAINGTPFTVGLPSDSTSATFVNGSHQNDLAGLDPPKPSFVPERQSSLPPVAPAEAQKDSEGFSIPPADLDPISQAQRDAALADESSSPALNVNIRDAPIPEDSTATGELANVQLQAPPPSTKRSSTIRGRRTDRNSAIVNSAYIPAEQSISEFDAPPSSSAPRELSDTTLTRSISPEVPASTGVTDSGVSLSPVTTVNAGAGQLAASTFSPFSPQAGAPVSNVSPIIPSSTGQSMADTRSIRSTTTTSQGASRHPDLIETGLNSSIIETFTARFENGQITGSSLIGEVALAYNASGTLSPPATETIRLENFNRLEKVAPNPAFIDLLPERSGEYTINLSSINRSQPQIAFKYQVRLGEDDGAAQAPLLITPALRIEANQCSVIVSYSLNPAFTLKQGHESLVLSNVLLALTLEGTKATGCQSRPVGTFARERNLIYWQLNEIRLVPGAAPEKLLARFATESEATSASVEGKWELLGEDVGSLIALSVVGVGAAGEGADPFADESAQNAVVWKPVGGARKVVSGSYVAR